MKIGIYTDAHFSLNSSIILGTSGSTSGRLDHLVQSFKWMYRVFNNYKVDAIVDCGDLTDSSTLRAEEISAVTEALSPNVGRMGVIPEYHILGNHERLSEEGHINSINFINNYPNHIVITKPSTLDLNGCKLAVIPYSHYDDDYTLPEGKIAFSHIDIYGADLNGFKLKSGVEPDKLVNNYELTINGHLHNGSWVRKDRIINLGALSGQNFSSKSVKWEPSIAILDTDTMKLELIANPHALRFNKFGCNDIASVMAVLSKLDSSYKYGVQLTVPLDIVDETRDLLSQYDDSILASRVMTKLSTEDLGGMTYEEVDKVTSVEGGFETLRKFIDTKESLPYEKDEILSVIHELEVQDESNN